MKITPELFHGYEKKVVVEFSLLLSYEDRKKFADFFNVLVTVERRVQARKKEAKSSALSKQSKNKKKIVQLKVRDPTFAKVTKDRLMRAIFFTMLCNLELFESIL